MEKIDLRFTKRALEGLTPSKKVLTYHDTHTAGLKLLIYPAGKKTFVLYRRFEGKPKRFFIGHFPDFSVEQARLKVAELNSKIASGEYYKEKEAREAKKQELTLEEQFQQYLECHAKLHKKTWMEDVERFKRFLEPWKKMKLSEIKRKDVQDLVAKTGVERGIHAANKLLALISIVFSKAIEWGWPHNNPAKGIKKFKTKSRDRFIQPDEIPRFFSALNEEGNHSARDFILLSLLTGARKGNVLAMRWQEVSFERKVWTIPETKNGDEHLVPLVDLAIDILKNRKNDSHWVFPGTGKRGFLFDPAKAWRRVLAKAQMENFRIHDLRRSLGSWQAATGASLSVIGKTLAHKNVSTTAIYARLNLDPVRESMEKATSAILEAAKNI